MSRILGTGTIVAMLTVSAWSRAAMTPSPDPGGQRQPAQSPSAGATRPAEERTALHAPAPPLKKDLWQDQVRAPYGTRDWLVYGGNLKAWRFSSLTQIDKKNVKTLRPAWSLPTGMHDAFETTPLVVDGTMYFSTPWNNAYAVNAKTGQVYWRYVHPLPKSLPLCCGAVNRGVALGDGKVFMGTLDAHLVAVDARTGKLAWDIEVANRDEGYSITSAPTAVGEMVVIGVSGGDFGIRGFIAAYAMNDGKEIWRWWCVPSPGEPGSDTWAGDSWKHGGGGVWMPLTYDRQTSTLYAGVGNPGPDLDGSVRQGDNLHTECTVALDPENGRLKWYFQLLPHDVWDLDNVTETVLDEITLDGRKQRVAMVAGKNGYFYVFDADTGRCHYAIQFAHKVNWGTVAPDGTPHPDYTKTPVKDKWTIVYPGAAGGKEWCPVGYDPQRKRLFIPAVECGHRHKLITQEFEGGLIYWTGASVPVPGESYGHLVAIDVEKKKIAWDKNTAFPLLSGVTCTASGLVITGTPDQKMQIYDADTGEILYEWRAPSGWHSAPVVYEVDGTEYIAFGNGWGGWVAGYAVDGAPELGSLPKNDNVMYAFALAERVAKNAAPAAAEASAPPAPPETPKSAAPREG